MTLSTELDVAPEGGESLLATARDFLDARNVSEEDRDEFFASLEAVFNEGGTDEFTIPDRLTPVWKDVLQSISQHLWAIPALVAVTADDKLHQLIEGIRASPQKSFAERVNTSPVRLGLDQPAEDLSEESEPEPPPPPPPRAAKLEIVMTESEHEALRKALERRRESESRSLAAINPFEEPSELLRDAEPSVSEEIPADPHIDVPPLVVRASSSDFKIDRSAPLSSSED
jgi:hypothetical protein